MPRQVTVDVQVPLLLPSGAPYASPAHGRARITLENPHVASDDTTTWTLKGSIRLVDRAYNVAVSIPRAAFANQDVLKIVSTPLVIGALEQTWPGGRSVVIRREPAAGSSST